MNRIRRKIVVRLLAIKTKNNFFNDIPAILDSNLVNNNVRIISIREKKHLIKLHAKQKYKNTSVYFLSVVRERNTWQVRALGNGKISSIPLNQGILGDPYYFFLIPRRKLLLGFTTGPSGSLKSTANAVLQQFNKDRTSKLNLEPVTKEREFEQLKSLSGYHKLHFKVDATALGDSTESAPDIFRQLSSSLFLNINSEIALTISEIGEKGFSETDLIDIVSYLSENDGCSALTVQGFDDDGAIVHLDFNKAYAVYKTEIVVRNKFIDEENAESALLSALEAFDKSMLLNV
ncbi:MAG: hypothetical protein AB2705_17000 [Candidatus Thiodiazotropha sp.]